MNLRYYVSAAVAGVLLIPVLTVGGFGIALMKTAPLHNSRDLFRMGRSLAMWSLKAMAWVGRTLDPNQKT